MKNLIPHGTLPGSERADIFSGLEHGDIPISMFLVHNRPGDGPELHRHPYAEIFVLHAGKARFQVDGTALTAGAGDVVIAPAGAAHRFKRRLPPVVNDVHPHRSRDGYRVAVSSRPAPTWARHNILPGEPLVVPPQ